MPRDMNGVELKVGDVVMLPCIVKALSPTEKYTNMELRTVEPCKPTDHKTYICCNTGQVVKPPG